VIASAIGIVVADLYAAYRTSRTTVREVWPTLSVTPTTGGAGLSVAGRF
jgi:hypothetical protein